MKTPAKTGVFAFVFLPFRDGVLPTSWGRTRIDGKAAAGIVVSPFLGINNRAAFPNFKQLRRRPSAMRRDGMNVALTAHRLIAELSRRIYDYAKQEHAPGKLLVVFDSANVHRDRVNGVGARA